MSNSKAKPSHIYSSISVAIVMFLLGIFVLLLLHAHNLTNIIKEKMNIVAELEPNGNHEVAIAAIKKLAVIRQESVVFIPKEDALSTMNDGEKIAFDINNNPFSDVITFNVRAIEYDVETLSSIKESLESNPNISSIYYEDLTIQNIKSNLSKIAYAILGIGLVFIFLAIIIIRNTINLSMYADRWEIKTMELIGAKWGFIKMPYIKTSVLVGFRAFIIAAISIMGLLILVNLYFDQVWEIVNFYYILIALAVIAVLSLTIPAITTNAAANKYLKKNMDALYE